MSEEGRSGALYDIPMSRRVTCKFCADILDSNALGVYEWVEGWAVNRKSGTNALALEKRNGVFACGICIMKLRKGIPPGQESLFNQGEW